MKKNEKAVFHPSLGICDITEYDQKSGLVTLVSSQGNQSKIPSASMAMIGIRKLMDKKTAEKIMEHIFHPIVSSDCLKDLDQLMKRKDYASFSTDSQVDIFVYLLNWKYHEHKSGMKNQECLDRLQDMLCEELAYVLDMEKEQLITKLIHNYQMI